MPPSPRGELTDETKDRPVRAILKGAEAGASLVVAQIIHEAQAPLLAHIAQLERDVEVLAAALEKSEAQREQLHRRVADRHLD